jgi:hypothetical protein
VCGVNEQPVTSPDQNRPENLRIWRALWGAAIVVLLLLLLGNHTGRVEDIFLVTSAGLITLGLVWDAIARKKGWKAAR